MTILMSTLEIGTVRVDYWQLNDPVPFYALAGNDTIFGTRKDDYVNGGSDDDYLFGGDGNDTLNGATGSDLLVGGVGSDELIGGSGEDSLVGAGIWKSSENQPTQSDSLRGGLGSDRFFLTAAPWGVAVQLYASHGSQDLATIVDFNPNEDKIVLAAGLISDYLLGNEGSWGGVVGLDTDGDKIFSTSDEIIALVKNVPDLSEGHFIFV
jgi:Ca2+-binding RTX toxin-like protein